VTVPRSLSSRDTVVPYLGSALKTISRLPAESARLGDDMLTAEGVIGKIVSFIVDKTIGKISTLPFDKRRKACRSLTKLYYSVQALDDVTENFLETLDQFRDSGNAAAVVHALNNHRHEVELATNMFVDLGYELHAGLEIIDPVLAACCRTLYVSKGDFLAFLSNSIRWNRSESPAKIIVKRPLGRMEAADLEDLYGRTKSSFEAGVRNYWPSSALDDFASDFEEIEIGFEDEKAATELRDMIVQQNARFKTAKERLRQSIKDRFSIEEVLFQTDTHPYR
jgi:hypothetical protein